MSLKDLNEKLYDPDSKIAQTHSHEVSGYDPSVSVAKPSPFDAEQKWNQSPKGISPKKKKILIALALILGVVALAIAGFFAYKWWLKNAFHQDRVEISFEGPGEADSTQVAKYKIKYKNNNRITLKNAQILLTYSENFQPIDNINLKFLSPSSSRIFIGDIKPMSEGSVEFKGIFYAPKDFPVYLYGAIHFIPSNGSDELSIKNQIGVNITAAPVVLDVMAPQQVIDGYDVEYVIDYRNLDTKRMSDTRVKVELPEGFRMDSAQPMPSENDSEWYIGNIEPNQGGKISIRGQLNGSENEKKSIVVSLGHIGNDKIFVVFNKQEKITEIVLPILTIKQSLENKEDNIVNAGDVLRYLITYENTGSIGLRDAIVSAQITGKILDFSKINVDKGSYDGKTNTITWKSSDVPSLAVIDSQKQGTLQFSIPVKTIIPIENNLDKNFTVTSVAKIDSPDIPISNNANKVIGSNKLELRLASKVIFDTKGYYKNTKIKNSGPLPIKVGSETTFSMHWSVINVSNNLSDVRVVSSLPSGVRWTGKIYPENEKISYNERTNQVIWEIGNIGAGTGILSSPRAIEFQVGVTPQINQVDQSLALLNQALFTAKDIFVNKNITLQTNAKDTQLYEDPSVGYVNGKVSAN
jgi:hypothetical protein